MADLHQEPSLRSPEIIPFQSLVNEVFAPHDDHLRSSLNTRSAFSWRKSACASSSSPSVSKPSRQSFAGHAGWFDPKRTFFRPWLRRYATSSGGYRRALYAEVSM